MQRIRTILASTRGRLVTAVAAAVVLLGVAGMTSASAAGQITSGGIANQTIQSWDVAEQGIGKSELRTNSVGQIEVKAGAVGTGEIKDGNVTEADLSDDVKSKLGQGPQGEPGQDGVSGYEVVGKEVTVPAGAVNQTVSVSCPAGKVATGGGYHAEGSGGPKVIAHESAPAGLVQGDDGSWSASGWTVRASNPATANAQVQAYVLCASAA